MPSTAAASAASCPVVVGVNLRLLAAACRRCLAFLLLLLPLFIALQAVGGTSPVGHLSSHFLCHIAALQHANSRASGVSSQHASEHAGAPAARRSCSLAAAPARLGGSQRNSRRRRAQALIALSQTPCARRAQQAALKQSSSSGARPVLFWPLVHA